MGLSFFWTEVSLQFKKQEKEKRNPGKEKKNPGKGEKEYKEGLEEKGFACLFSCFFQGGKGRKKERKIEEKRDKMEGKKGQNGRKKGIK